MRRGKGGLGGLVGRDECNKELRREERIYIALQNPRRQEIHLWI